MLRNLLRNLLNKTLVNQIFLYVRYEQERAPVPRLPKYAVVHKVDAVTAAIFYQQDVFSLHTI
jgi:hypothetical protein